MAFNITATLQRVESYLLASGYFAQVTVGEPKAPPSGPYAAAVFMSNVGIASTTLQSTIESHVVTVRLYRNMLDEPERDIEIGLANLVASVSSDLLGDYDLGGDIRNVDAAGSQGTAMGATWGYVDVGGRMYRIADLTLPLVVDDSATFAK